MNRGESRKAFLESTDGVVPDPCDYSGHQERTLEDLPKNWRDVIFSHMGKGASEIEIKALLGLGNSTHARWMREPDDGGADAYAEYREVVLEGRMLCQAWWERIGRRNLGNKSFHAVLWHMNMVNRFRATWKRLPESVPDESDKPAQEKEAFDLGGNTIEF